MTQFSLKKTVQGGDSGLPLKSKENSLPQEVHQKSDISECRSKGWKGLRPLQPLLCLPQVQLCHCLTCQGSSYTKNEYSLFYQKFDAEYFFIQQFLRIKLYFQRKPQKTVLGRIWQFFRERHLTPKINVTFLTRRRYRIFYYLPIFSKNV